MTAVLRLFCGAPQNEHGARSDRIEMYRPLKSPHRGAEKESQSDASRIRCATFALRWCEYQGARPTVSRSAQGESRIRVQCAEAGKIPNAALYGIAEVFNPLHHF